MAKIIGNPTTTPIAPSDWNQNNPIKANNIKNKPTKLSQFINDIDSLPSVVYTEIDNFTDGICKVTPKSSHYFLDFRLSSEGDWYEFVETDTDHSVNSEFFALCLASDEEDVLADTIEYTQRQTLIFGDGGIYTRSKWWDTESVDGEWSKWKPRAVEIANRANRDYNGRKIHDTYATKEELADSKKWKTLLDVTLTEEQAGVSELLLAIEDVNAFVDARYIRIAMSIPIAEAKSANAFYSSMRIRDKNNGAYNQTFMQGYNKAGSANAIYYTTTQVEMFDFAYDNTYKKGFQSIFQLPNPYFTVSANSVSNASVSTGGFNPDAVRYYPPYLEIKTGAVTMEAGTHIFMEVCE